jgi:Tat protein secretion system quality control protein TatD with DNase activity
VTHTAAKVAEMRGISAAELAELTTANALRRFRVALD